MRSASEPRAGLAYDGGLVVNAALRTPADARILAAGPLAKFSRSTGGCPHARLSSSKLGAALATSVLSAAADAQGHSLPAGRVSNAGHSGIDLAISAAAPLACNLPGGARFVLAATPERAAALSAPPTPGGTLAATNTPSGGACRVLLDAGDRIELVAFLGPADAAPSAEQAEALVALPASLLADDLPAAVASGAVPCLATLLRAPWLTAARHAAFRPLLLGRAAALRPMRTPDRAGSGSAAAATSGAASKGELEPLSVPDPCGATRAAALGACRESLAQLLRRASTVDLPAYRVTA